MRQSSLTGFEKDTKKTRKEQFLEDMERIVPWSELTDVLKPYYPDPAGPGRLPNELERMLRIYFMQPGSTCLIRAWRRRSTTHG